MVGGQVNPIISIIIDNNNKNNNNNNNNNIPLNGFQHQFLKRGLRKVFTSTAAFRLQDLCIIGFSVKLGVLDCISKIF